MRIAVDLELPGFERALAGMLPAGVELRELELTPRGLRMGLRAPMVGDVDLTAQVSVAAQQLTLHGFDLRGAGLAKGMALSAIRQKIAGLDKRLDGMQLWGEADGERAHLRWGTA